MDNFWSFKYCLKDIPFEFESYACEYFEDFLFWSSFIEILVAHSEGVELFWK